MISKRNWIITGGGDNNLGAQAMTLEAINFIKRNFPESEIYVLNTNMYSDNKRLMFDAKILPSLGTKRIFSLITNEYIFKNVFIGDKLIQNEFLNILNNSLGIIDVSGYAFSSHWKFKYSLNYLSLLYYARLKKIPIWLMPQSYGPFNWNFIEKSILKILSKYAFESANVYARERQGIKELSKFVNKKISKSPDLVLLSEYSTKEEVEKMIIKESNIPMANKETVCIVPSVMMLKKFDYEKLIKFYKFTINHLIKLDYKIWILPHSGEDKEFCLDIYKKLDVESQNSVEVLLNDYNCIHSEAIIKQVEFLVASRYHSLILGYKNLKPSVIVGWSYKYVELAELMNQSEFILNNLDDKNMIEEKLNLIHKNTLNESKIINKNLKIIREKSPFDDIKETFNIT